MQKDVEAQPLLGDSGIFKSHDESTAIIPVVKKLWLEAIEVFYIFFVTLSLFPGVMFGIKGDMPNLLETGWLAVIYVSLFQVFDYVGRQFTSIGIFPAKYVWFPVALRTVFFPLFVLCVKPLVFVSNWWGWSFMVIFATTNGYFGCTSTRVFRVSVKLLKLISINFPCSRCDDAWSSTRR